MGTRNSVAKGAALDTGKAMKNRIALPIGLCLWALASAAAAQQTSTGLIDQYSLVAGHVEKAKKAFRGADLSKCEKEALFCLAQVPEHHEAHFLLSQVLYKRGQFDEALEHIVAAEDGYLKLARAVSLLSQENQAKRLDNLAGLVDDAQESAAAEQAAKNRASCGVNIYIKAARDAKDRLSDEKKPTEIDGALENLRVPADYHYIHGNCLFRLKRLPEAEAEYRLAVKIDPGHGGACNNLINLLFIEGRLADARASLAEAEVHKAAVNPGLKKAVLALEGR
jgi:tetratricopeptide (TPR) repeat protein